MQDDRQWITIFAFVEDKSKEGRILSVAKIGDVYMSRLMIEPGVLTGNLYHQEAKVMFYVERGSILALFEHIDTKERQELLLEPGKHVVHVPTRVAHSTKNIGRETAVIVFLTSHRLRSGDDYPYSIQ